jgi:3-hydroxyisobutyrate dehydrogenase-like beta-hydroxyacid dehydrogenase
MCRNIMHAGYPLVVHTRTASRAAPLVALGARLAESPAAVAAGADAVFACLDTLEASEQVFLGSLGLVASARPGTLLVDHSTISPELAARIGDAARGSELAFADAPVSGGPEGAEKGTLAIMVGATEAAFDRALPIMRAYGGTIVRMGGVGAGTHAKLVNQLLTFVHGAAAAEAIALARRASLDLDTLAEVLRASFGHSRMLDRTLARVQAGNYDAGAALTLFRKDLGIVRDVGVHAHFPLPVTDAALSLLRAAFEAGLGERDVSSMVLTYPDS